MPVEPGNLMLLGKTDHNNKIIFVLGMPGCARSQKENGVDWILWRLLCGLDISNRDINDMGTGGLLWKILVIVFIIIQCVQSRDKA